MTTYISLLRGINVGGQRKIKMDDLKALYASLNFKNIKTYIQSGNVVFKDESLDDKLISKMIKDKIFLELGMDVSVIIRNPDQLRSILLENPFLKEQTKEKNAQFVTFLSDQPGVEAIAKLNGFNFEPDEFIFKDHEVYVYCPNGYGKTKLNNAFFENKLKLKATSRNLRTISELIDMAQSI